MNEARDRREAISVDQRKCRACEVATRVLTEAPMEVVAILRVIERIDWRRGTERYQEVSRSKVYVLSDRRDEVPVYVDDCSS
jgi:predicted P-loop ATPase/GTPase